MTVLHVAMMDEEEHRQLLSLLLAHPGKVMISGYDTPLYSEMLKGWKKEMHKNQVDGGLQKNVKKYFVRKVSPQKIFSTKLNIDFSDGSWQLSVDERTSEHVKAQFSKDGKFVLVSGMKEGNSIINISREDETYGGSILVRVEEPEEWYKKLQEEMKLYSRENRR